MTLSHQFNPRYLVDGLLSTAAEFYRRGWMWGTSGNLSVKLAAAPLAVAITGSGANKGELTVKDMAIVPDAARGQVPWAAMCRARPSAETAVHLAIYRSLPDVGAVYHVHTVASTLISLEEAARAEGPSAIEVRDLEMLKGWGVEWSGPSIKASIPIFPNRPSMEALAEDFSRHLATAPAVPVVIVPGHGMTVWGKSPNEARNRLEIAEFVCQVLAQQRLAR